MILAFSPEQAHEVAQAFDIPSAVDASWWMNNEMFFPNLDKSKASEHSNQEKTSSTPADAKPAPKDSDDNKPTATCASRCPAMNGNPTFRPCRRFNQAVRCQMKNNARVIEQRTPIHMHQETDDAAKMSLDVTGFAPEDISIHIEDYIVSIQGKRTNKLGDVFVINRRFRLDKKTSSFDQVTAAFDEGILELTVPKKSIAGPRKIPIVVSGSVADSHTQAESIEEEESFVSSHEENINVADESVEDKVDDEEPQSTEDKNEENEKQEQDAITVETVHEDNAAIEDDDDQQSHTNGIVPTKSAEEEETWEEVSK